MNQFHLKKERKPVIIRAQILKAANLQPATATLGDPLIEAL